MQYTFTEMNKLLYEGHPYASDQIGSAGDVTALTQDDLEALRRNYLAPGSAVLALSGDIGKKRRNNSSATFFPVGRAAAGHCGKSSLSPMRRGRGRLSVIFTRPI